MLKLGYHGLGAGGIALAMVLPTVAFAAAGDGVKVGDGVITPSVDVGAERRSNLNLEENKEDVAAGTAMVVSPSVQLEIDSPELVLSGGVDWRYRRYLFGESDNILQVPGFNDIAANADIDVLPEQLVGLRITEDFNLADRSAEFDATLDRGVITHMSNDVGAALSVHPGASLSVAAGGHFVYESYRAGQIAQPTSLSAYNKRSAYGATVDAKWTFFPRTALTGSFTYDSFAWVAAAGDCASCTNNTGKLWQGQLGMVGRLTGDSVVNLQLGYGKINSETIEFAGLDGLIGTASVDWSPVNGQKVSLGVQRDFRTTWFTDYLSYNSLFFRYKGNLSSRFVVSLDSGLRLESYTGDIQRVDAVLRNTLSASYSLAPGVDVMAYGSWRRRASVGGTNAAIEYDDYPVGLLFTFSY